MLHVLTACFCTIMCFSLSAAWTISKRKKILKSKCYCTCYCLHVLNIVLNTAFDLESIDFSKFYKHSPRKTAIVQCGVSYYWRPHWCSHFETILHISCSYQLNVENMIDLQSRRRLALRFRLDSSTSSNKNFTSV